jgi:CBS domain-containing protein
MEFREPVRNVLSNKGHQVASISPEASVYDAIALMAEKGIGALLVTSQGKLVGILSERDYARKVVLKGKHTRDTSVGEIMSSPVLTVRPDETIEECMNIVTENRIRHLPVMEDDRIVGIVSIGDLVKWIVTEQQKTIQELKSYITGRYPS